MLYWGEIPSATFQSADFLSDGHFREFKQITTAGAITAALTEKCSYS